MSDHPGVPSWETFADARRLPALPHAGLLALTIALFWVQLIGHEAGHHAALAAAKQFYPPMAFAHRWPLPAQVAFFAGGPVFTVALIALCALAVARLRRPQAVIAITALGCSAVTRIIFVGPATLIGAANDERTIGQLLGMPPQVLGICEMLLAAAAVRIFWRAIPHSSRRATFIVIGAGALVGLLSALALGPLLGIPVGGLPF